MNNIEQALTHAIDQKSDVVATLLQNLLQEMRSNLNTFFDAFDPEAVRAVIEHLVQSKGALFLTGVGKVYPFMRSHKILDSMQQVFSDIPIVMFYPGEFNGQSLILFEKFLDGNYYRAFNLL